MIQIDNKSSLPIYQQIVDKIKEEILKGTLEKGDRLPSVRELSAMITANPNTVSRAYSELERQKVIETMRGRGTYVTSDYEATIDEKRVKAMQEDIKKIIIEAKYMGISKEKLVKMVSSTYESIEGDKPHKENK